MRRDAILGLVEGNFCFCKSLIRAIGVDIFELFSFSTVECYFCARADARALVYFTMQGVRGHAHKEFELSAINKVSKMSLGRRPHSVVPNQASSLNGGGSTTWTTLCFKNSQSIKDEKPIIWVGYGQVCEHDKR